MKKALISVTALSVLGIGILFGGFVAHAEDTEIEPQAQLDINTPGEIKFIPDVGPIEVFPPGDEDDKPDVDIPTLPGPGLNIGPLTIAYAPTLNFGEHVIDISTIVKRYPVIAEMQRLTGSEERVPYVSFVQVQDRRGTNDGWTLNVTASEFLSDNDLLRGARIEFFDSQLQYSGHTDNQPTYPNGRLYLEPNEAEVMMQASNGNGSGISSLMWGDQADLNRQHNDEAVEEVLNNNIHLEIPGDTILSTGNYRANLNWQLVAGVDNT